MEGSAKYMYQVEGFLEERPRKIIELCEYLTPVMNELHDTDYSERFWTTLVKNYVKTCVNREHLMSEQIIRSRPAASEIDGWELPTRELRWKARIREILMAGLKSASLSKMHQVLKSDHNICVGLRGEEFEEFGLGTYCASYYPVSSFILNGRLREKLASIAEREESVFKKNLLYQLPRFLVEDFKKNINRIELHNPQNKIFHAEHLPAFMMLMVALYVENGAKYYLYQLGAWAGETVNAMSPENYVNIDKFRTYGWKIHEKDEPHVAYRLEQFSRWYNEFTTPESYDICIVYNQVNSASKKRYKDVSELFFKRIDLQKYRNIILRPRGTTKKLDNSGELAFLNAPDGVKIDKGMRPMHELVRESRVMVHLGMPSTNFLECVYVNHPVAAILTVSEPTEIIKPYYQFFLDQNVLHQDMESLIHHLNNVDIDEWWEKVVNEPMYLEFKNNFARKVE